MTKPYPRPLKREKKEQGFMVKNSKCLACNKSIDMVRGKIKLYCNAKCKDKYYTDKIRKNYREKSCLVCGSKFNPKKITQKYCSRRCNQVHYIKLNSKKPIQKICVVCEKEFNPFSSLDKFCSYDCRINNKKSKRKNNWTKEQTDKRKGENNPAYRNGMYAYQSGVKRIYFDSAEYRNNRHEIRQQMIDDVGYVYCQHTGRSDSLRYETHHIIFRSEKPGHPKLDSKENLIILGIEAHNEFHKHKWIRDKIVKERGLDKIFGADVLIKSELKKGIWKRDPEIYIDN